MEQSKALEALKINRVKGILATAVNMTDKALIIEKEIGLESAYAMISMGKSLSNLASSLGLSIFEFEYMLKRTSEHRKRYINAVSLSLAEDSVKVLKEHGDTNYLETEQAAALKHHSAMLDKSIKIVNAPTADTGGNGVIVNNTVVVRSKNDVPDLPEELQDVLEGEYDVGT